MEPALVLVSVHVHACMNVCVSMCVHMYKWGHG